ncbi:hypothetical protein BW716_34805 [[Flexibacter] sp. ATCC 35208]|nr:hypothetical protein BW716_34805 [[Flexibacter] sp. ATCC 35208]
MVSIRKRLGIEVMSGLNEIILQEARLTKANEEKVTDREREDDQEWNAGESNSDSLQERSDSLKDKHIRCDIRNSNVRCDGIRATDRISNRYQITQ